MHENNRNVRPILMPNGMSICALTQTDSALDATDDVHNRVLTPTERVPQDTNKPVEVVKQGQRRAYRGNEPPSVAFWIKCCQYLEPRHPNLSKTLLRNYSLLMQYAAGKNYINIQNGHFHSQSIDSEPSPLQCSHNVIQHKMCIRNP